MRDLRKRFERDSAGLGFLETEAGVGEGDQGPEVVLELRALKKWEELIGRKGVQERGEIGVGGERWSRERGAGSRGMRLSCGRR